MTSSINPNNIDGAYPVAGQDNNSQGFRDNFTNTKTNFAYAANEITDLQNKAVLKAALTGTTLNNDMGGSILSNFQGQNISQTVVSLGTLSGSVGINYTAGSYQTVTTNGSISLAFTNFTAAGTADYVVVQITVSNVADTVTFPSAVGSGASATSEIGIQGLDTGTNTITYSATGTYIYSFTTTDGGTTIYLNDLTQSRNTFSGNVTATNLFTSGVASATGNITGGNIRTAGLVSATGNISGGNLNVTGNIVDTGALSIITGSNGNIALAPNGTGIVTASGNISAVGNISGGNILTVGLVSATANITGGNLLTAGIVSATANIAGGNVLTVGLISSTGNVTSGNVVSAGVVSRALDVETISYANITSTATYSLSTSSSINVLIANNTGYTATINMPSTPVEGQICNFAIHGNTVTLAVGTGTVLPTFAGSTTVGTGYRYVYRVSDTSWYRIG
jgi:filamentous hemagglutinin